MERSFSDRLDLLDTIYLGDDVSVGFDNEFRVVLVKDRSDGAGHTIVLDSEVMLNFVHYIIQHDLL